MDNPTVVLTDTGELQLTSITRHCLLHTIQVLQPDVHLAIVLPQSGSRKIEDFCVELQESILSKQPKKKTAAQLPEDPLVPSIEIHRFHEGAIGSLDFMLVVEKKFLEASKGSINLDLFHRCCWKYYKLEERSAISFPKWFSPECTYRLWLIYNCVLEPELKTTLSLTTTNEVMKRLVEYCGYSWNSTDAYETKSSELDFTEYLFAITSYFEKFKLEMSLTCEVIGDMVDEIVNGVLKTGRLTKKGHVRKNWKTRWFVLQRTVLRYYMSRDNMILKGQLVLNGNTEVRSIPDKGRRKFCFHVTCGHTGTPFEITADDQRSKHEWMLAIKKAIALAKVLDGSSKADEFAESLQGFYLLKYGTAQPLLSRQDSTVRKMKYHATLKKQRKRLSASSPVNSFESSEESSNNLELITTSPEQENFSSNDSDSDDEGKYVPMQPLAIEELLQDSLSNKTLETYSGQLITKSVILEPTPDKDESSIGENGAYDLVDYNDKTANSRNIYDNVHYDEEDAKDEVKAICRKSSKQESPCPWSPISPLSPTSLYPAHSRYKYENSTIIETNGNTENDDGKEGSYIQLVHRPPTKSLQLTLSPSPTQELVSSDRYEEAYNWTGHSNPGSTNPYLTLLRDSPSSLTSNGPSAVTPTENAALSLTHDIPPAVPAHKKSYSPSPSPTHKKNSSVSEKCDLPPVSPRQNRPLNTYESTPSLPTVPPPLPPRRASHTPPTLLKCRTGTPPPLPAKDNSPTTTLRRATMMSPTIREIPKTQQMAKNSRASYMCGDSDTNIRAQFSPPAIPPR